MRYIGSKTLLLTSIEDILKKHLYGNEETFLDLFAGTNVVGNYFKKDYTIYSNDLLYFSYVNAKATIENNEKVTFNNLKNNGIKDPFDFLQNESYIELHNSYSYYEDSYTPKGNAQYLSSENGKRIDYIRETIEQWKGKDWISEAEYFYLLSSLIESIPFVSNTTGTYGAFLKHWDKRALKPLELKPLKVVNNFRNNKSFNEDSNVLVRDIEVDIAYIDPPYNSRQYASNYHLLENVARHEKPELKGTTKLFDWSHLRSDYSTKNKALKAMEDLIENINATHVVLSYNDEGIIPFEELINLMQRFSIDGKVDIEKISYPKYNSKKPSKKKELHEFLIYIQRKQIKENKIKEVVNKNKTVDWEVNTNKYIKSPLNYVGGKYKLLKQILPFFPTDIDTFVDIFSGGANVGINVQANYYIFNDMNSRINEMFRYFAKQNPTELVDKIKRIIEEHNLSKTNQEAYLNFREKYNNNPNPLDLYILISFSYNYQIRFNNSMIYNNPFGKNRSSFSENMEKNLKLFISKLKTINHAFTDQYFTDIDLSVLGDKDFVYLDPPYLITTGSYNDGNRGFTNWDDKQELKMYELMNQLTQQNVRYALSNVIQHKGKTNELLNGFIEESNVTVHYLDYHYNNSSHNTKGSGSTEVLITNYHPKTHEILCNKEKIMRLG
ncbi:Dam family site-specific DNA-(adenine-N6)-methyltransferase [Desemzia sp. FAM 23991]|uniref:Dam family site-specific DNA-(adenine-N6)-methyltransferase n=1 Tax=Desemzia sp. FAM 23991 TaxID=3259521 RepID=UPI003889C972